MDILIGFGLLALIAIYFSYKYLSRASSDDTE